MLKSILSTVLLLAPGLAVACPSSDYMGQSVSYSAAQLATPQVLSATAAGLMPVDHCTFIPGVVGHAEVAPDFSFFFSQMGNTQVAFDVQGDCDSTLIAHTADGRWHFNDDGGVGLMPQLTLGGQQTPNALNGRVDLWIGTYRVSDVCPVNLTVRAADSPIPQQGCPDPSGIGQVRYFTGPQMTAPQRVGSVPAQGATELWYCSIPGVSGVGQIDPYPAITLELAEMTGYALDLSFDAACDTTMLVHTADGQWRFNNDGAGRRNPAISLRDARETNGRVNVWLGRNGREACMGSLTLQTSRVDGTAPPQPPSAGCPNPTAPGGQYLSLTGAQLASGLQRGSVSASGAQMLQNCGINGYGYFDVAPDYTFALSGMEGYALDLSFDSACDSTMLVNAADGTWHFNDDSNGNLDPRLGLRDAGQLNGQVQVWIGRYGNEACMGSLTLQTTSSGLAAPEALPFLGVYSGEYHNTLMAANDWRSASFEVGRQADGSFYSTDGVGGAGSPAFFGQRVGNTLVLSGTSNGRYYTMQMMIQGDRIVSRSYSAYTYEGGPFQYSGEWRNLVPR